MHSRDEHRKLSLYPSVDTTEKIVKNVVFLLFRFLHWMHLLLVSLVTTWSEHVCRGCSSLVLAGDAENASPSPRACQMRCWVERKNHSKSHSMENCILSGMHNCIKFKVICLCTFLDQFLHSLLWLNTHSIQSFKPLLTSGQAKLFAGNLYAFNMLSMYYTVYRITTGKR